jgi:hypothetical protein
MHATNRRLPEDATNVYTKAGLHAYDALVMGVFAKQVWDCHPDNFLAHYRRHLTSNHAEIGIGTGYCLDHCGFRTSSPRLALIDLQPNCLEYCAKRLARFRPETHWHDARQPMRFEIRHFDSIAICGLLHCLPGDMRRKCEVFDALQPIAAPGTRIFGYTLVSDAIRHRARRRYAHRCLNHLRIIQNMDDKAADLSRELSHRFVSSSVESVGCIAFFSGTVPQRTATPGDASC